MKKCLHLFRLFFGFLQKKRALGIANKTKKVQKMTLNNLRKFPWNLKIFNLKKLFFLCFGTWHCIFIFFFPFYFFQNFRDPFFLNFWILKKKVSKFGKIEGSWHAWHLCLSFFLVPHPSNSNPGLKKWFEWLSKI